MRGFRIDGPEGWDLINGEPQHWSDPLDPERRATWEANREAIMARWVRPSRPGWRPHGWVTFDLPELAKKGAPWRREVLERWAAEPDRAISLLEFVHGLKSTSDDERVGIEELWREDLALVAENPAADVDVPAWFVQQK